MEHGILRRRGISPLLCTAVTVLVAAVTVPTGQAGTVYVNGNAHVLNGEGLSWSTAFRSVQQGLNAARSGDEVWVAAGLYRENIDLRNGVALYGGFLGTETRRSQRDWAANPTVLHGDYQGSVVTAGSDVRQRAVLDGFTIRDGEAASGGAINCYDATVLIAHNKIIANTADDGGAVYCDGVGDVTLANNIFHGNRALRGGAVLHDGGSLALINNTIVGNNAPEGGAVYLREGTLNAFNNIIAYNRTGIVHEARGSFGMFRNNIYGNGPTDYEGPNDPTQWNVNMRENPRLVNWADGSCRLTTGSPCIDAGDNNAAKSSELDVNGQARLSGDAVDIGAFEYSRSPVADVRRTPAGRALVPAARR